MPSPEVHGRMLVASRGESRHEVLQMIVEAEGRVGAVLIARTDTAHEVYRRDGRDPDAWQFLACEQITDLASPLPPEKQQPKRWAVTHAAYWRTTEDPS